MKYASIISLISFILVASCEKVQTVATTCSAGDIEMYNDVDTALVRLMEQSAVLDSGLCGPTLNWKLYSSGLLKIYGTGRSYDFVKGVLEGMTREEIEKYDGPSYYGFQEGKNYDHEHGQYTPPWYKYRDEVDFETYTSHEVYDSHNPNGWIYTLIYIAPGITYVGDWMFYRVCSETITLPEGVEEIADWGIRYSPTLKRITIPSSVKRIGDNGISRNEVATVIRIGNSVEKIGENGLGQNAKLKRIILPQTCRSIGNSFFMGNEEMEYVDLGGIEYVPDRCCVSNYKLSQVILPDKITRIEEAAFYQCNLSSFTIPASVDSIYRVAFYGCENLKNVYIDSQKIARKVALNSENGFLTYYLDYLYINTSISCPFAESSMHYEGIEGNYKKYSRK